MAGLLFTLYEKMDSGIKGKPFCCCELLIIFNLLFFYGVFGRMEQ